MNGAAAMEDEAGATDNRIYWNPDEQEITQDWQDGETYRVTLLMKQTTAGEGQLLTIEKSEPAQPGGPAESAEAEPEPEAGGEPEETQTEPTSPDMMGRGMGTGNPAIDRLIASKKY